MLPYFYIPTFDKEQAEITLDEDSSRHIVQVLRMQPGEFLRLTDGKGTLLTAVILNSHKNKCRVKIDSAATIPPGRKVAIAIPPLKNGSRFEWFLEKAAEIGVSEIIPILSQRTERQHLRHDRLHKVLVSALLQSQQAWLPVLHPLTPFSEVLTDTRYDRRLIAHCLEDSRPALPVVTRTGSTSPTLILIGPEGDFSPEEVASAVTKGFISVTLGENRLRTETAGVVAATLLCIG